jgi:hemerythrin-like metal-binding protein
LLSFDANITVHQFTSTGEFVRMMIAVWSTDLETGYDVVDDQHRNLFRMINEMYEAMSQGKEEKLIARLLSELSAYTIDHFEAEQRLMQKSNYPDYESHKALHDELRIKVKNMLDGHNTNRKLLSGEFALFLASWLNKHIRVEDQRMIAWFNAHK